MIRLTGDDLEWLRAPAQDSRRAGSDGGRDRVHAWLSADATETCELEQAFAAMHVLLTGTTVGGDGPLSFIRNEALGEKVPYTFAGGPGRVLEPGVVRAIADAIEAMSARVVRQRLDSDELRSSEPFMGRSLSDDDKEWLLAVLQGLMVFMRRAATDRAAVLVAPL